MTSIFMRNLFLFGSAFLFDSVFGQTCLSSPPELAWTDNGDGSYSGSMTFDAATFTSSGDGYPAGFTTRVHDGDIPSPTIRMERGKKYFITLNNNLEAESPSNPTSENVLKDPNTTNIHTHGLHISGESPSDSIFVKLLPGESFEYEYNIPCDHAGSLAWYHPHHHGSTTLQVAGGAAGMIVIEDDSTAEGLPSWYTSMDELLLIVQSMDLQKLASLYTSSVDYLTEVESSASFYLVNGEYKPTICMTSGEWMKFRIQHVDIQFSTEMTIPGCEIKLLALDGVLVHGSDNTVPRDVSSMHFQVSSRADVAVHCPYDGTNNPSTYALQAGSTIIADIQVSGTEASALTTLTTFNPIRPSYLESLLNYNGDFQQYPGNGPAGSTTDTFGVQLGARTVNGAQWSGPTDYAATLSAGTVNEWSIQGAGAHPFHLHVNHMQIQSGGDPASDSNWIQVGDWLDTLGASATVRFRSDRWGGDAIMHCHILEHEDQGAMGIVYIDGGCDAQYNNFGSGSPACDSTCDSSPTLATTATPTMANALPTGAPTDGNLNNFTPSPSASPVKQPTSSPLSCGASGTSCSSNGDCCSNNCKGRSCRGA